MDRKNSTTPEWLKKLSFDKWRFKDLAGEQIELFMDPLRDKDGNPFAYTGLILEGDNLVANSTIKLMVK